MEHGLRKYEAQERLLWFLFLLICLLLAFPAGWVHLAGVPQTPAIPPTSEAIKSCGFWSQLSWMHGGPFGKLLAYLMWAGVLFTLARFLWVILQFVGKSSLGRILSEMELSLKGREAAKLRETTADEQKKPYRGFIPLISNLNHPPRFVFHAYRRALSTVAAAPGTPASDALLERQERLSAVDRKVLNGSRSALRWMVFLLPLLAALQSFWLIYPETQSFLGKQTELEQLADVFWPAILPAVQVTALAIILSLACGFLKRLEGVYLANLDALLYDQMLCELPIRSADTLLILESLQKNFRDLQIVLKRVELELKNRK